MTKVTVTSTGRVTIRGTPFRPSDRLEIFTAEDTMVVKRVRSPERLSDIALRAPGRPMPMRDIVREVRAVRRAKAR